MQLVFTIVLMEKLRLVKVEADNDADAVRLGIGDQYNEEVAEMSVYDLQVFYNNCDMNVEVMQV